MSDSKEYSLLSNLKINRKSNAYRKATAAGFTFSDMRIHEAYVPYIIIYADFKCVCGKIERFQRNVGMQEVEILMNFHPLFKDGWDVAQECENFGSFSVEHLTEDGFSEEAIKEIRWIYDLEDEVKELRRIKHMYEATVGIYYDGRK